MSDKISTAAVWLELYRSMLLIRHVEEKLASMFADSEIPGFIHLSIGQEAVPVGVSACLRQTDTVASNHRGHGHALAKGLDLDRFFLEILGKDAGQCRGRGGSMHIADMAAGMLGANGIVGAGIPLATGSALAHQIKGRGDVAISYFGDGALAEGAFHESANLAALWRLPVLFVCEDNGWSEFSPTRDQFAADPVDIAEAFGLRTRKVDGNDVFEVAAAARALVEEMRSGTGAALLHCRTLRVRGHFEGDAQKYRAGQTDEIGIARDPITLLEERLANAGTEQDQMGTIRNAVSGAVEQAVRNARAGTSSNFAEALRDVYSVNIDA